MCLRSNLALGMRAIREQPEQETQYQESGNLGIHSEKCKQRSTIVALNLK